VHASISLGWNDLCGAVTFSEKALSLSAVLPLLSSLFSFASAGCSYTSPKMKEEGGRSEESRREMWKQGKAEARRRRGQERAYELIYRIDGGASIFLSVVRRAVQVRFGWYNSCTRFCLSVCLAGCWLF